MKTNTITKVHVIDDSGLPRYNHLIDDGSNVMPFKSRKAGRGFIRKDQLPRGFTIVPGWFAVQFDGYCDWKTIDPESLGE